MRQLLTDRTGGSQPAHAAFDVYVHRLCQELAGMTAALGRLDAVVFTGGIGEYASVIRAAVTARLSYLGLALQPDANDAATADAVISPPDATTNTVVVSAREDLEIARQVHRLLQPTATTSPDTA